MPNDATAGTMPASPEAPMGAMAGDAADDFIIKESRFGSIAVRRDNVLQFARGLLGFADLREFGLAELPDPRLGQFKLFQSMQDEDMSFLVLPLGPDSELIAARDIDEACEVLSLRRQDIVLLLIVSVRQGPDGVMMSVNLRAPLIIDSVYMSGVEDVLSNTSYSIRHPL